MLIRINDHVLDTEQAILLGPDGQSAAGPVAARVLGHLVERAPATVSSEELIQAGWQERGANSTTLRRTIASLRDILGDSGPDFQWIATRHSLGYQFIGPVETDSVSPPMNKRSGSRRVALVLTFFMAALALVLGVPQFTATGPRSPVLSEQQSQHDQHYRQAQDLLERGEVEAALEYLTQPAAQGDGPGELALPFAQALAASGNYPAGRAALADVAATAEDWPRQRRLEWQALSARLAFEFDQAADHYQALNQYHPDARISRSWIQALIDARRLNDAQSALEALESTYPDDPRHALLAARLANAASDQAARLAAAQRAALLAEQQALPALGQQALLEQAEAEIKLGRFDAARALLEGMASSPPRLQAEQGLTRADIHFQEGSYPEALASLAEAEQLFEGLESDEGLARALIIRGNILEMSGQADQAMAQIEQAIALLEQVGDPRLLARAHINLGISQMRASQAESALENLALAQGYFRRSNNAQGEAVALLNTGTLMARNGRRGEAESAFERSLQAFESAADQRGQAIALSNLAGLASARRDSQHSILLNQRALVIFEAMKARPDMARVALNLGLAYRRLGELALSENHMRQASQAFGELGIVPNQARSLTNLGRLMLDMGKPDRAREIIDSLRQLDPEGAAEQAAIDHLDGELAQYEERFAEAGELMEAARAHHLEDADSPHVLLIELELAELRLAQGELITAEREARRLADRFADLAYTNERIQALMLYADALLAQQRADEARDWLQQAESLLADAPDAKQRLQLALLTCRLETLPERRRQLEITRQLAADQGFGELWATAQAQLTSLEP